MVEALYSYSTNETGSQSALGHIGYFPTLSEAMHSLRGLCCWDFSNMWGYEDFKDIHGFQFKEIPATLDKNYDMSKRDNFIEKAKKHAKEYKGSWHRRSPDD